ncbi:MAG: sulfatase [Verrucomicrobiota bacterium]
MKRHLPQTHLTILLGLLVLTATTRATDTEKPPNIVFLLADDLGWTGLGCYGSDLYETPNLDRLASEGCRFTQAYAACTVCSPTRASLMTGQYPARLHLTDFIAGQNRPFARLSIPDWTKELEHRHDTLAEALKKDGYHTSLVGKWHLERKGTTRGFGPTDHGFNESLHKPIGTRGYYLRESFEDLGESKSRYGTDYLTDQALEVIDREARTTDPFFLMFGYHTPHTPIQGRKDLVEAFQKKVQPGATHKNPTYAAMVKSLDQSVGRILERLDRHQLTDNTVVVFMSDNGGLTQRYGRHDGFTENLPLRRGKGSAYEGGVRVPMIVKWPGKSKAGTLCHEPVCSIDWFPTFLPETPPAQTDGRDLSPLLQEPTSSLNRNLYWHYPHYHAGGDGPYSAIRSGDWRLIHFHEGGPLELYHLKEDIGEKHNLAEKYPEKTNQLMASLDDWRKEVAAQMPRPNPAFDPAKQQQVTKSARKKSPGKRSASPTGPGN